MRTEQESTGASELLDPDLRDAEWVSTREFESDVRRREVVRLIALIPLVMLLGYAGTLLNQSLNKPPRSFTAAEEIRIMEFENEHYDFEEAKKGELPKLVIGWQIELLKKYGSSADLARWEGYQREVQAEWDKEIAEMPWLRPH